MISSLRIDDSSDPGFRLKARRYAQGPWISRVARRRKAKQKCCAAVPMRCQLPSGIKRITHRNRCERSLELQRSERLLLQPGNQHVPGRRPPVQPGVRSLGNPRPQRLRLRPQPLRLLRRQPRRPLRPTPLSIGEFGNRCGCQACDGTVDLAGGPGAQIPERAWRGRGETPWNATTGIRSPPASTSILRPVGKSLGMHTMMRRADRSVGPAQIIGAEV